jgi:hypothetical protein
MLIVDGGAELTEDEAATSLERSEPLGMEGAADYTHHWDIERRRFACDSSRMEKHGHIVA